MSNYTNAMAAEYVADTPSEMTFVADETLTDLATASELLVTLLETRIRQVASTSEKPLALMLSGGIDSILVAAICDRLGLDIHATTILAGSEAPPEDLRSREVATALGFTHNVRQLSNTETGESAARCLRLLDSDELWEVTSAIPVLAAFEALPATEFGPVLTGAGADALFMGGGHLKADPASQEGLAEFRHTVTLKVKSNFTRNRLIPDYYERLLQSSADRFIQVFQTAEFWRFAMSISPSLLWRIGPNGQAFDKYLLRYTAQRLGISENLVWTNKSPLQVSSGVIGSTVSAAREKLANIEDNLTYADPLTEPVEHTAARLYLQSLNPNNAR